MENMIFLLKKCPLNVQFSVVAIRQKHIELFSKRQIFGQSICSQMEKTVLLEHQENCLHEERSMRKYSLVFDPCQWKPLLQEISHPEVFFWRQSRFKGPGIT